MTEVEFSIITRGSLRETIDKASIQIGKKLPTENIRLISFSETLAEGWDDTTNYIVEKMYHGEDEILPCADLIVDSFEDSTTTIRIFIANYLPRPFGLNWADGVGPYLKMVNGNLLPKN